MTAVVETRGLTKRYGAFEALVDLNLLIGPGIVYGFIGPNGAGKTTAMRIIATLLDPTAGTAWVAGYSVARQAGSVRQLIGYMPDTFGVYHNMKVWEYLDFFAATYGIPKTRRSGLIADLLALVDLGDKQDGYVEALSRGMKQRLCVARTLVHDPQLLILDEPASGLDPRARIELRALLRQLGALGKTVIVSSHILTELADMCDHVGIIERGRLLASGPVADLLRAVQTNRRLLVRVLADSRWPDEAIVERVQTVPGVLAVTLEPVAPGRQLAATDTATASELAGPAVGGSGGVPLLTRLLRLEFSGDDRQLTELLAELIARGVPVFGFTEEAGDLEDVFMRVTKGL